MTRLGRTFVFAAALAVVVSLASWRYDTARPVQWAVALLICLVAWRLYYRKPPRSKSLLPAPGTRAYARAMFFNGLISLEELHHFYETHPETEEEDL